MTYTNESVSEDSLGGCRIYFHSFAFCNMNFISKSFCFAFSLNLNCSTAHVK